MFTQSIKKTGYAIIATATIFATGAGFATTAQAAPLNINPVPLTQTTQAGDLVQVGFKRGFRGHRGGFRGRGFHRGHRSSFKGHGRSFNRGHHRSSRFSRHGRFHHKSKFRGHFKGHGFYGRGLSRR